MPKLTDPDSLNQTTEIVINPSAKTIQLLIAGNLADSSPGSSSGVTLQAVYSFLKEEWKSDTTLNKIKFPIKMFTKTDGQMINGWDWADAQTRQLIRDGGWTEGDGVGDQYAGIISLGSFDATGDQAYYQQVSGFTSSTSNFDKTGNLNESIKIYESTGPVDYRGYLKTYLRIQGKLYSEYNLLAEQGIAQLEPVLYRLPLSNGTDLKINAADAIIDANVPYTGMGLSYLEGSGFTQWGITTAYAAGAVVRSAAGRWFFTNAGGTSGGTDANLAGGSDTGITWEVYAGERQIGASHYAFNRVIDGNAGTAQEVYNWAQRELRRATDINDSLIGAANQDDFGTVNGNVATPLLRYVGDTLVTYGGVYIDDFDINDQNRIEFFDITVGGGGLNSESVPITSTKRTFPFVSAGVLNFSANLVAESDVNTKYTMYFTTNPAGNFDTTLAVVADDNDGVDITGQITGASIPWSFNYDGNVQGGRTAGTDAAVTVVAQGLGGAEWVLVTHLITRTTGQSISVTANDERNYANP